jgi:hypothetical protein
MIETRCSASISRTSFFNLAKSQRPKFLVKVIIKDIVCHFDPEASGEKSPREA